MSVNLSININQLKRLITQCDLDEKIELIRFLEKDTFPVRFKELLTKLRTDELTLEEITTEVETVREQRFNAQTGN